MLEKLLNKLIEKGRKPFGIYGNGELEGERICIEEQTDYTNEYRNKVYYINTDYVEFNGLYDEDRNFSDKFSIRDIVSKGSGLWQFVCENGMININYGNIREYYSEQDNGGIYLRRLNGEDNYEYRLIEASLKDESELESFILDNIKIEG